MGWQALQQEVATLKEEKTRAIESLKSKETELAQVVLRLESIQQHQDALQKNNAQLLEQCRTQASSAASAGAQADQDLKAQLETSVAELEQCKADLISRDRRIEALNVNVDEHKRQVSRLYILGDDC